MWVVPGASTPTGPTIVAPVAIDRPNSSCSASLPFHVSATTKIVPVTTSSTGVLVIPTVGEMSPHGRSPDGTGVARCRDHMIAPVTPFSA